MTTKGHWRSRDSPTAINIDHIWHHF